MCNCYYDAWSSFTAARTENEKLSFLARISCLHTFGGNLLKVKNLFLLKILKSIIDFDTNADWFKMFKTKESICMADFKKGKCTLWLKSKTSAKVQ